MDFPLAGGFFRTATRRTAPVGRSRQVTVLDKSAGLAYGECAGNRPLPMESIPGIPISVGGPPWCTASLVRFSSLPSQGWQPRRTIRRRRKTLPPRCKAKWKLVSLEIKGNAVDLGRGRAAARIIKDNKLRYGGAEVADNVQVDRRSRHHDADHRLRRRRPETDVRGNLCPREGHVEDLSQRSR